jgi:hypothetical protein
MLIHLGSQTVSGRSGRAGRVTYLDCDGDRDLDA